LSTPETTEAPAVVEEATPVSEETPETPETPRPVRVSGETAQTVGRRKEAVVRVRLTPGSG
jgi:small subunit ribosomal protein S9